MINLKSVKTQLILYLVCIAVFLAIKDKDRDPVFLLAALTAVISALTVEAFLLYLKTKTLHVTKSAIITGLIVGYVVSSDEALWKIALAAVLAILSKHLIRFNKHHIFNPAAFGIL
jgi:Na+-transporting NADH:ubiquinone oxidoreductase subunit NqrB